MLRQNSYITVASWIRSALDLKGSELLCFALIHGFCQDGESLFNGNLAYISEWLGVNKKNTIEVIKRLIEKNLIEKIERFENGVRLCSYRTNDEYISTILNGGVETTPGVVSKQHQGGVETTPGGGVETTPPINKHKNYDIYNINNIITPHNPPLSEIEQEFEDFWKAYTPVKTDGRVVDKGSKKMSLAKYKLARKHATKQEIMEGLQKYIQHCIQNRILTCGVPVFLNQERWKNEYGMSVLTKPNMTAKQQERNDKWEHFYKFVNEFTSEGGK